LALREKRELAVKATRWEGFGGNLQAVHSSNEADASDVFS